MDSPIVELSRPKLGNELALGRNYDRLSVTEIGHRDNSRGQGLLHR